MVIVLKKEDSRETAALRVSLMPPGLLSALGEQEEKDLMSYLLTPKMGKD